jgi:predicted secreted protein
MDFRHSPFIALLTEDYLAEHAKRSKETISRIRTDKSISQYDTFNKRFKLNLGMQIEYEHEMTGVTRAETQLVYKYMLKISDLWGAFEHLYETCDEEGWVKKSFRSSYNLYDEETQDTHGFQQVVTAFNEVLAEEIYPDKAQKRNLHVTMAYLKKHTNKYIGGSLSLAKVPVKENAPLSMEHINALVYGLRNLYIHKGVAASMGLKSIKFRVLLYSMLYEYLVVCCYRLGVAYCKGKCGEGA